MEIKEEIIVVEDTIIEHQHCYSMAWCKKSEIELNWNQKTLWVGSGRLLISKDGEIVDLEGSAPGVDWIHHFELKMFGLEDFWILEIPYSKENISKLKSILKQSTPELLKLVNDKNVITFTESKAWNDNYTKLAGLSDDLNQVGIECQLEIKTRKKAANNG